jgi:hypothetical protein
MPDAVVAGVGVAGWHAGTDLFLDVARRLAADPELEIRWVGRRSRGAARRLDLDAELAGLSDRVVWSRDLSSGATPSLLIVPARTAESRQLALEEFGSDLPFTCFHLPGVDDPLGEVVAFPDTAAMAERVRSMLGRPGEDPT